MKKTLNEMMEKMCKLTQLAPSEILLEIYISVSDNFDGEDMPTFFQAFKHHLEIIEEEHEQP